MIYVNGISEFGIMRKTSMLASEYLGGLPGLVCSHLCGTREVSSGKVLGLALPSDVADFLADIEAQVEVFY